MNGALDPSWNPFDWTPSAWALMSPYILAVLALGVRQAYRWHRRPRIAIVEVAISESDTFDRGQPGPRAAYGRLLVRNVRKKDPAEDAHVVVISHQRVGPAVGKRHEIRMPLTWSHSDPAASLTTVHGGSPRWVDLVAAHRGYENASLETHPKAAAPTGLLDPQVREGGVALSRWRVDVELVARHVAPVRYAVFVQWDGAWRAGEIGAHLQVIGLRPLGRSYGRIYDVGGPQKRREMMTYTGPPSV